jgi:hypothetical protein
MGGGLSTLRIPPSADEERALVRCAFRLLVGYVGGAAFVIGLLHLVGSVGATWHALTLLTAGAAAAAAGTAGARMELRDFGRGAMESRYRQGRTQRSPMADHNLGRRVG